MAITDCDEGRLSGIGLDIMGLRFVPEAAGRGIKYPARKPMLVTGNNVPGGDGR